MGKSHIHLQSISIVIVYWIEFVKSVFILSGRRINMISLRNNCECIVGRDYLSGGLIATSICHCAAAGVCPCGGKFE